MRGNRIPGVHRCRLGYLRGARAAVVAESVRDTERGARPPNTTAAKLECNTAPWGLSRVGQRRCQGRTISGSVCTVPAHVLIGSQTPPHRQGQLQNDSSQSRPPCAFRAISVSVCFCFCLLMFLCLLVDVFVFLRFTGNVAAAARCRHYVAHSIRVGRRRFRRFDAHAPLPLSISLLF